MPRKLEQRWDRNAITWYKDIPNYCYGPWWGKVGGVKGGKDKFSKDGKKFLINQQKKRSASIHTEPVFWEVCRRNPSLLGIREEFPSFLTETAGSHASYQKENRSITRKFPQTGRFLIALMRWGHLPWPDLPQRHRLVATKLIQNLIALAGYPGGKGVRDLSTDELLLQQFDFNYGAGWPEEKTVKEILRESHSENMRLMILQVDPRMDSETLVKQFKEIIANHYKPISKKYDPNLILKYNEMDIQMPVVTRPSKQFKKTTLHSLRILDEGQTLEASELGKINSMFKAFDPIFGLGENG